MECKTFREVNLEFWGEDQKAFSFVCLLHNIPFFKTIHKSSSSSSSCDDSTDFPDSLPPSIPITHCSRQVFQTTSCICTKQMLISSCWSANTGTSMGHKKVLHGCGWLVGWLGFMAYQLL